MDWPNTFLDLADPHGDPDKGAMSSDGGFGAILEAVEVAEIKSREIVVTGTGDVKHNELLVARANVLAQRENILRVDPAELAREMEEIKLRYKL